MMKGTTPTLTMTLPDEVNLEDASRVFVTFSSRAGEKLLELTEQDIELDKNVARVFLTQAQTLGFPDKVGVQVNWTYTEAQAVKRACSNIVFLAFTNNLKKDEVKAG